MFFFVRRSLCILSLVSCWSFALCFLSARLVARLLQLFLFFFSLENKNYPFQNSYKFLIRKAHAAISINTQTTKMPSEEQQLPEPLLDDGGNDRFVLFPLKYDAVWEMVRRRRLLRKKNIFEKFFCVLNFWKFVCADVSSLSLSYFHTLQYKKAQASFWTAGTFHSFLLLSSSFFLLSYLCSS